MLPGKQKMTVVSVNGVVAGVAIACDSGAAWITQCCDSTDYLLTAGMDFAARREGKIVVQVVRDGKISIRLRSLPPKEHRNGSPTNNPGPWPAFIRRWSHRALSPRRCGNRPDRS